VKPDHNITMMKIMWCCHKFRHTSQWNEFDNPEKSFVWELNGYEGFMKIHWATVVFLTNDVEAIRQHV
jgi:hypothetical protein